MPSYAMAEPGPQNSLDHHGYSDDARIPGSTSCSSAPSTYAESGLGSLDEARARQQVVHAGALDRYGLQDRALAGGKEFPNIGCDLEIIPNERLVWTDALLAGYRLGAASSIRPVSLDNVPNAGVYRFGPVAEG
jgi:hypothetical protein